MVSLALLCKTNNNKELCDPLIGAIWHVKEADAAGILEDY